MSQPLSEQAALAYDVLSEVIRLMEFPAPVEITVAENEDQVSLSMTSSEPLGVLIGKGGQTLNALEMLVKEICFHKLHIRGKHIMLDAEDYRKQQTQRLEDMARECAEQVLATGESVPLEPMSARDRRTVHMIIADIEGVASYSSGEEPYRHLVICLPGQEKDE
jgi:spoIIIJ-associated protein